MPAEIPQIAFSGGVISPSVFSRVDLAKFGTAVKTLRNFFVRAEGGTSNRAGFQFVKKTDFSIEFYTEALKYAQNENIITDLPNICGLPNYPEFEDHRHDQSILTNLAVKHNIKTLPDPSQCGNHVREEGFSCIIDLHRRG